MNDVNQEILQIVHKAWQEILNVESVDLSKDYMAHGFHSVFIFQIISQLNEKLHVSITMREFIENQSILKLTSLVQKKGCIANESHDC